MKWTLFIHLLFAVNYLVAQEYDSMESLKFVTPLEIKPKWTEGTNQEMTQEITSNVKFPKDQCVEGITILRFVVDTVGQVKEPKIMRSISKKIDYQLLKIIGGYKFEPGIRRDKRVEVYVTLPIRFKLE